MRVPEFTAEAALGRTPHGYRRQLSASHTGHRGAEVVPQVDPYAACYPDYIDCMISGPTSSFCERYRDCVRWLSTI